MKHSTADVEDYLSVFDRAVNSPFLIVALGCAALAVLLLRADRKFRWLWIALALWAASLAPASGEEADLPLIGPLQMARSLSRPLAVASLIMLTLSALGPGPIRRARFVDLGARIFLGFQLLMAVIQMAVNEFLRGALAFLIYLLMGAGFLWGSRRWLRDEAEARELLRAVAVSAAFFAVGTFIQMLVNPDAMLHGGQQRLHGTTGNAQHAALLCSTALLPCVFLALDRMESRLWRLQWAVLCVLLTILLLWTGSRTGAMVAVIGLGVLLRRRGRKFLAVAGGLCLLVWMAFELGAVGKTVGRLGSMQNTRAEAWSSLWDLFMSSPLTGVPLNIPMKTENSYLLAGARFGLLGLLPLLLAMLFIGKKVLGPWPRLQPRFTPWLDLLKAGFVSLAFGAFFEGYLLAVLGYPVMTYIYFVLLAWLADEELSRGKPA